MLEHNDISKLHVALYSGAWHRLRDLPSRSQQVPWPTLWPALVQSCSRALALDALATDPRAPEHLLTWAHAVGSKSAYGIELWLRHRRERSPLTVLVEIVLVGVAPGRHPEVLLVLARETVTRKPSPEREAALAVLERWPVG